MPQFTPREMQVFGQLFGSDRKLSAEEIAFKLKISPENVSVILGRINEKFDEDLFIQEKGRYGIKDLNGLSVNFPGSEISRK